MGKELSTAGKKITTRLIASVLTGFAILVGYFLINTYQDNLAKSESAVVKELRAVAKSAAMQINASDHMYLTESFKVKDGIVSNEQDATYQQIYKTLHNVQVSNKIGTNIYTMFLDEGKKGETGDFFFGVSSAAKPFYRHTYESAPQILRDNYLTGGEVPSYEDDHGTWLSAFEPIKNQKGRVVGVVQVDKEFGSFIAEARKEVINYMIFSVIIFLIVGLILIVVINKWVKKGMEEQQNYSWLKTGQTQLADSLRGDKEIGELSTNSVDFLAEYVNAQAGAIYLVNKYNILKMVSSYAFDLDQQDQLEIKSGEGIIGQVARDKKNTNYSIF